MQTLYLKVDPENPEVEKIQQAARLLQSGGTVAFPTETVYGLGANALDKQAVLGIFRAKGRPADNPLIVHIAYLSELLALVRELNITAERLIEKFWPGPLTLIFRKSEAIPDVVTANLDTVAVRMPAHPVARALLKAAQLPVAAPSANLSGRPSPTTGRHVFQDLEGRIQAVVDGGKAEVGVESTVLDMTGAVPVILRPGGITHEQLADVLGQVEVDPAILAEPAAQKFVPRSPGMKYRHYAPRAKVFLFPGEEGEMKKVMRIARTRIKSWQQEGKKVGVLASKEQAWRFQGLLRPADRLEVLGSRANLSEVASSLYQALRNCDCFQLDVVLAETFPATGLGTAVMNRLVKAAGYRYLDLGFETEPNNF